MNKLKIRKMDSKTKYYYMGTYCSAIGWFNYNGFKEGVAYTIGCLKQLSSLITRAQRMRDELTADDIAFIDGDWGNDWLIKFDGILATGRVLMHRAKYVQSHPGKYTGYPYYYPNVLRDLKAMCKLGGKDFKFGGKDFNNWVQEVKDEIE